MALKRSLCFTLGKAVPAALCQTTRQIQRLAAVVRARPVCLGSSLPTPRRLHRLGVRVDSGRQQHCRRLAGPTEGFHKSESPRRDQLLVPYLNHCFAYALSAPRSLGTASLHARS